MLLEQCAQCKWFMVVKSFPLSSLYFLLYSLFCIILILLEAIYPASRDFFLAHLLACMKSFASLVFHVVYLFTSPRETSAPSRSYFPLSMHFRHLQILGGRSPVLTSLSTRAHLFLNDLLCKSQPA